MNEMCETGFARKLTEEELTRHQGPEHYVSSSWSNSPWKQKYPNPYCFQFFVQLSRPSSQWLLDEGTRLAEWLVWCCSAIQGKSMCVNGRLVQKVSQAGSSYQKCQVSMFIAIYGETWKPRDHKMSMSKRLWHLGTNPHQPWRTLPWIDNNLQFPNTNSE